MLQIHDILIRNYCLQLKWTTALKKQYTSSDTVPTIVISLWEVWCAWIITTVTNLDTFSTLIFAESLVYQYLKCIYIKNKQMFQYVWIEKVQFQGLKRHMVITHIPWILWCMSWQEAQLSLSLSTLSAVARGGPFHGAMASVPSRAEIHVKWIYMKPAWHGPEIYLKTSVELNSSQASQISKKIKFKHSLLHKCVDKEWSESQRKFLVQVLETSSN